MFKSIEEVPDEYRHIFYPPKVMDFKINLEVGILPEFFSKEWRDERIMAANLAFFLGPDHIPEKPAEIKMLERLKYAYIYENNKHYITYVDNETMKAYRLKDDSYYNGLLCPLEEIPNCTFDRWCRGMDL